MKIRFLASKRPKMPEEKFGYMEKDCSEKCQ